VPIPPPGEGAPSAFVAGGTDDWVVDAEGVRELAAWCGVEPRIFPRMAHDMMLVSVGEPSAAAQQCICSSHPGPLSWQPRYVQQRVLSRVL